MKQYISIMFFILHFITLKSVSAADVLVSVNGTILSTTCTVSSSSKNQTVNMGEWSTSQITTTSPVRFTIDLADCGDISSGFTIKFSGTSDSIDNSLLSLDPDSTAKNIALEILDSNKEKVPLNESTKKYTLSPDVNNTVTLVFWSKYVATSGDIIPGIANANVTFEFDYQ